MNRAKVVGAAEISPSGAAFGTLTTRTAGAGAGVWPASTTTWAATHNEQLACVTAPSAWRWATWTVPSATTINTHSTASNSLLTVALGRIWRSLPIH